MYDLLYNINSAPTLCQLIFQVVAGKKYSIVFTARETTCSKQSNEELTESCEIKKSGVSSNSTVYLFPGKLFDVFHLFVHLMNNTVLSFGFCFPG